MYSVSNDFKTAIKKPIIVYSINGTIGEDSFTEADVHDAFTITNQCSSNDEIQIGSVYIGELNITLLLELDAYETVGKEITLQVGVKLADDSFEYVPMGVFTVAEAEKTKQGLKIKAYDNMSKLDVAFSDQAQGTAYQIVSFACTECGLTLANADFDSFPNHSQTLMEYPDSDIETYRDLLFWLAQTLGCFVTANRDGEIEFRAFGMSVVDSLYTEHRFTGGKFADYISYYTGLSVVNIEEQTTSYYALPDDDGLTYNLGSNPFLQYNNYDQARQDLLSAISSFEYVPFSISIVANPMYDLGDGLSFPMAWEIQQRSSVLHHLLLNTENPSRFRVVDRIRNLLR